MQSQACLGVCMFCVCSGPVDFDWFSVGGMLKRAAQGRWPSSFRIPRYINFMDFVQSMVKAQIDYITSKTELKQEEKKKKIALILWGKTKVIQPVKLTKASIHEHVKRTTQKSCAQMVDGHRSLCNSWLVFWSQRLISGDKCLFRFDLCSDCLFPWAEGFDLTLFFSATEKDLPI